MSACTFFRDLLSVRVTGISIEVDEVRVVVGGTVQLTATIVPANATNPSIAWRSSDSSIAQIDKHGTVTGIAEGTTTIVVETDDGSFTDTCVVEVVRSQSTDILSFSLPGLLSPASIDVAMRTVLAEVEPMDLSSVEPVVEVPEHSTCSTSDLIDGQPVPFVVTDSDGNSATWEVTVNVQYGISFDLGNPPLRVVHTNGCVDSNGPDPEYGDWGDNTPLAAPSASSTEVLALKETVDLSLTSVYSVEFSTIAFHGVTAGVYTGPIDAGFAYRSLSGDVELLIQETGSSLLVRVTEYGGRNRDDVVGIFSGVANSADGGLVDVTNGLFKVIQLSRIAQDFCFLYVPFLANQLICPPCLPHLYDRPATAGSPSISVIDGATPPSIMAS